MSTPPARFDEAAQPVHYLPRDGALVRCLRCDGQAVVRSCRVTCPACGYGRDSGRSYPGPVWISASGRWGNCGQRLTYRARRSQWSGQIRTRLMRCPCGNTARLPLTVHAAGRHEGVDPCSGLALWLAVSFRGRVLWAVNADHLTFLENYVAADLRETPPGNGRLASRIPAWIKSAKNRDNIVRSLARLRARLDDPQH